MIMNMRDLLVFSIFCSIDKCTFISGHFLTQLFINPSQYPLFLLASLPNGTVRYDNDTSTKKNASFNSDTQSIHIAQSTQTHKRYTTRNVERLKECQWLREWQRIFNRYYKWFSVNHFRSVIYSVLVFCYNKWKMCVWLCHVRNVWLARNSNGTRQGYLVCFILCPNFILTSIE